MTPKARFQEECAKDLEAYRGILHSPQMAKATETALLHYLLSLNQKEPILPASDSYNRLAGAREVLEILTALADQPGSKVKVPTKALNYKV